MNPDILPRFTLKSHTTDDKWNLIKLMLFTLFIISVLMLFLSLSVSSLWGSKAFFHAFSVSIMLALYSIKIYQLVSVNNLSTSMIDFTGGVGLTLTMILFQSAVLWQGFGTGLGFTRAEKEGEQIFGMEKFPNGHSERNYATLAFIACLLNGFLCYSVFVWKAELLNSLGDGRWNFSPPPQTGVAEINISQQEGSSFQEKFGLEKQREVFAEEGTDDYEDYQKSNERIADSVY